jgi:hypothetical protein
MLMELAKREKEAGIFPEKDVDVYMKVSQSVKLQHMFFHKIIFMYVH